MPMKLRDGKLYESRPTPHMLLRDGKVVDASQSLFVDKSGILQDGSLLVENLGGLGGNRGHTPVKDQRGGTEARNSGIGRKDGLSMAANNNFAQREVATRRSSQTKKETTSEISQQTSVTVVGSNVRVLTRGRVENVLQKASVGGVTPKTITTQNTKTMTPVYTRLSQGSGEFATSTPVTSVSQNPNGESSFFITERKTFGALEVEDNGIEEESFTKIKRKSKHGTALKSSINQFSDTNSNSESRHESIEDSIFEDLSKPVMYSNISENLSEIESIQDQTDFPRRRSLSYFDTGTIPSISLNHAKWSKFHHWRREWYLDRWNVHGVKTKNNGWLRIVYTKIWSILITIQTFVTTKISYFLSAFENIWGQDVKASKRRQTVFSAYFTSKATHHSTRSDNIKAAGFCYTLCIPVILSISAFVLIVFLLWPHNLLFHGEAAFNLTNYGMKNAKYVKFNERSGNVPAWHVFPDGESSSSGKSSAGNQFPVTFFIRNTYNQDSTKRVEIFKALSSAGYNVIIPVFPDLNLIGGWKGVRKMFNESSVILWGEVSAASDMQELAKELCKEGLPPSGVVIEIEEKVDKDQTVKELEVWSCNCTTVRLKDGTPYSYTHVKCPLQVEQLSQDVVSCLQALAK